MNTFIDTHSLLYNNQFSTMSQLHYVPEHTACLHDARADNPSVAIDPAIRTIWIRLRWRVTILMCFNCVTAFIMCIAAPEGMADDVMQTWRRFPV